MDSGKIKRSAVEAIMIAIGGIIAYMLKGRIPISGYIEAIIGLIIVFAGAYIDHEYAGPLVEGFGIVLTVDGLSASLPTA
ncbi:MAG: hypothetical protein QXP04_05475 [Candidatus Nanoarchaeia archaeon]|nr:hypothetical protein [Candidatus Jingweiarchaeum tengchongense]